MIISKRPAAPSVWPVPPLIEYTGTLWFPKTALNALISMESLYMVPVPWAEKQPIFFSEIFADLSALRIAMASPLPSRDGPVIWFASFVNPHPAISPITGLFSLNALDSLINNKNPDASPRLKPFLSLSKGFAISLSSAIKEENPEKTNSLILSQATTITQSLSLLMIIPAA